MNNFHPEGYQETLKSEWLWNTFSLTEKDTVGEEVNNKRTS